MSRYLDIATKKRELFLGANSTQQPKKSVEELKAEFEASQKRRKEEVRNPLALKIQEKVSKKLGGGFGAQLAGGFAGGLVKGIERPVRFLVGSGYGIGLGVKGALGDKESAQAFNQNINPFMTEEDMKRMKDPNDKTIALEKGVQMAGDVIPYVLPGGTSMKTRAGFGAASGFASGMAEPDKDLRSVATSTAFGAGTGVVMGLANKGFGKLRSISKKSPELRSGATPQLEAPEVNTKMLPAGVIPEEKVTSIVPTGNRQVTTKPGAGSLETTNPAIEGEIVDKTGLIKTATQKAGNEVIDAVDNITYRNNIIKKAVVGFKELLGKYGENGKKLSQLLDSYENTSAVKASTALNKFKTAWDKLKSQKSTNLAPDGTPRNDNEAVVNYILDIYNGKTPKGVTAEQRAVAESFFKDVTLEPSELAGKLGLRAGGKTLGKPRPFIPLIPKDINKFKQAHLERLMKQGFTKEKANATIAEMIDEMFNPASKVHARRFPGFENRRFFEPQTWQDLVDYGYESDIGKIAESWAHRAWKRIEGIQHFGGTKYEGLNTVLNDLRKQGADAKDIEYIKKSFVTFLEGRELGNPADEKLISVLKDVGSMSLSPSSGIKQPMSIAQTIAIAGPSRVLREIVKSAVKIKRSPDVDRIIDNAALVLDNRFDEGLMNRTKTVTGAESFKEFRKQLVSPDLSFTDKISATIRGISRINFNFTGIKGLDRGIRKLSGYSGYEWIKSSLKDLASGKAVGRRRDFLIEELNMFAFPNKNELLSAIDNGGQLTDEQLSKAIHHFVKKTQFGTSRSELPASWSNSAAGEIATSLRSYGFETYQFTKRLFELGVKTKNFSPLLTYLATSIGVGTVVNTINDAVMKGKKWDSFEDFANEYDLGDVLLQSAFGVYYDIYKYSSAEKGGVGKVSTGLGILGGPAASTMLDTITAGATTYGNLRSGKQDPTKELRSFLAKRTVGKIPYFGPKAVTAIKGERRSSSSSRKKTRY